MTTKKFNFKIIYYEYKVRMNLDKILQSQRINRLSNLVKVFTESDYMKIKDKHRRIQYIKNKEKIYYNDNKNKYSTKLLQSRRPSE